MLLLFVLVEIILIALYIACIVEATKAYNDVKRDRKDEIDADKPYYNNARHYLFWCVFLGWLIFGLSILGGILVLFFGGPEILGDEALESEGESLAEKTLSNEINKVEKQEKNGLLGLGNVTSKGGIGGFLEKGILFLNLGLLFAFGVLSAIAATNIEKTTDKKGYKHTIYAAILGIVPFSLTIVWFIGDVIYKSRKKRQLEKLKEKKAELQTLKAEQAGQALAKLTTKSPTPQVEREQFDNSVSSNPTSSNSINSSE